MSHPSAPITSQALLAEAILARRVRHTVLLPPAGESFRWWELDFPARTGRLTTHPEFELQLIRAGRGHVIIGDRSHRYHPGHIALIGPNVPHAVVPEMGAGESITAASAVVHFSAEWLGGLERLVPELHDVARILTASARGIVLSGGSAIRAADLMEAIGRGRGFVRIGHLFSLLATFSTATAGERHLVASPLFHASTPDDESRAAEAGLTYILANLAGDLSLAGAAAAAHTSESAFAKHFKQATGHTFTDTVRTLRIAQACRMLERTDEPVALICGEVGYRNLSNFNRQFRAVMGMSPLEYRRTAPNRSRY